ncbi:hypothetical protein QFZ74_004578 [Streptomyces sp. V3I7]|nr:hypothetical protein [Streptomyces sp. V3I7]
MDDLEPGRLPGEPHDPRAPGGPRLDQRPHPDRSFDEYAQVKHVMFDNTAVARKDWHRTISGDR